MPNTSHTTTKQFLLTVAASKRWIAKAVASLPQVQRALSEHTIAVIAGSTNGFIAEELLRQTGQLGDFSKDTFVRGVSTPPGVSLKTDTQGGYFGKDVILEKGAWVKGKNIFDTAPELKQGDIVIKGANAVNPQKGQAGILIGHPAMGTIGAALQASVGRRAELILPVGLEKRVYADLFEIAQTMNGTSTEGNRFLPVSGTLVTELEAFTLLTGASAELVSAGGVLGAEGACWFAVTGTAEQLNRASALMDAITKEPPFGI